MRDHDELRARLLATEIVRAFEVKLRVWGDKLPNSAVSDFMATVTWANAALARQEEGQPAPASPQGVSEAVETIKRIAAQLAVDDCEGDAADLIDALHDLTAAGQQAAGVSEEIVERLKIAARAIIRERKVYAEDVETLADVLRTLESLAAGRNEPAPGTTLRFGMGAFIVNTGAHAGEPAVFVDAAQEPGAVGEAAPTIPAGTTPVLRLLFPTKEQAQHVADALVNPALATAGQQAAGVSVSEEIGRLAMQLDSAASIGDERHLRVTVANVSEKLLALQSTAAGAAPEGFVESELVSKILAALGLKPIGQFYPGHTAAESEQVNETYYGADRREQIYAEIARLRAVERHLWHALDDAEDTGDSIAIDRNSYDYRKLDELLPEECPGCTVDAAAPNPGAQHGQEGR